MKSRCCRVSASAARRLSDSALAITRKSTSLMLRSSWASPGVGADRLFDLTFRGGAIEARQILLVRKRTQPFDFVRNVLVIGGGGAVGGIEANRFGIIPQRTAAVTLLDPGRAAIVVGALEFWIEFQRRVVIGNPAVVILPRLIRVAAVGQKFRLGTNLDRFVVVGDCTRIVAIAGEVEAAIVRRIPAASDRSGSRWSRRDRFPSHTG
jgi:hypothetical protein